MAWYDTATLYSEDNALPHYGLVTVRHHEVLPAFDAREAGRRFIAWGDWANAIVLSDARGGAITRYELLRTMADKQGAHIDLRLPRLYAGLSDSAEATYRSDGDLLVFSFLDEADSAPDRTELLPEPISPSVRQLAHEVLVSLANGKPDVFEHQAALEETISPRPGRFGLRGAFMDRDAVGDGPRSMCVHRDVRSAEGDTLG